MPIIDCPQKLVSELVGQDRYVNCGHKIGNVGEILDPKAMIWYLFIGFVEGILVILSTLLAPDNIFIFVLYLIYSKGLGL